MDRTTTSDTGIEKGVNNRLHASCVSLSGWGDKAPLAIDGEGRKQERRGGIDDREHRRICFLCRMHYKGKKGYRD